MPFDHCRWLNKHDPVQRVWPQLVEPGPEETVCLAEVGHLRVEPASQCFQLMPQRNDLQLQRRASSQAKGQEGNERTEDWRHGNQTARDGSWLLQGMLMAGISTGKDVSAGVSGRFPLRFG